MEPLRARCREEWEMATSASFVALEVTDVAPQFFGTVCRLPLDDAVSVSRVDAAACTVERTAALVNPTAGGDLIFTIQLAGLLHFERRWLSIEL